MGASSHPVMEAGRSFAQYRIVRLLGSGGMGAVYEAIHTGLDKRVALKVLHANAATDIAAVTRFLREGKAASKIQHPNVVDVTDVGAENGVPFLVMEMLQGEDLAKLLERE